MPPFLSLKYFNFFYNFLSYFFTFCFISPSQRLLIVTRLCFCQNHLIPRLYLFKPPLRLLIFIFFSPNRILHIFFLFYFNVHNSSFQLVIWSLFISLWKNHLVAYNNYFLSFLHTKKRKYFSSNVYVIFVFIKFAFAVSDLKLGFGCCWWNLLHVYFYLFFMITSFSFSS